MLEDRDFVSISKDGNKKCIPLRMKVKVLEDNVDQDAFTKRLEQFKTLILKN